MEDSTSPVANDYAAMVPSPDELFKYKREAFYRAVSQTWASALMSYAKDMSVDDAINKANGVTSILVQRGFFREDPCEAAYDFEVSYTPNA